MEWTVLLGMAFWGGVGHCGSEHSGWDSWGARALDGVGKHQHDSVYWEDRTVMLLALSPLAALYGRSRSSLELSVEASSTVSFPHSTEDRPGNQSHGLVWLKKGDQIRLETKRNLFPGSLAYLASSVGVTDSSNEEQDRPFKAARGYGSSIDRRKSCQSYE